MPRPNYTVLSGSGSPISPPGVGNTPPGQVVLLDSQTADILHDDGTAGKRVTVTVGAPLSGATPDLVFFWNDHPDSSGGQFIAAGGAGSVADGSVPASGKFNPTFIDFMTWDANGSIAQSYSFEIPIPDVLQYDRVYAMAGTKSFTPKVIQFGLTGASPSRQYPVAPTSTASGTEYAPNVSDLALTTTLPTGWSANPNITIIDGGDQNWTALFSFTWPTAATNFGSLAGVDGTLNYNGVDHFIGSLDVSRDPLFKIDLQPVQPGITVYTFKLQSYDANGGTNTFVANVTPTVVFTVQRSVGAAGLERTGVATNVVWNLASFVVAADGTNYMDLVITGTDPTSPSFGGYSLWVKRPSDTAPVEISPPSHGRNLPLEWVGRNPAAVVSWTFYLVSMDTNNFQNTISAATPFYTVNVGSAAGLLDVSKAKSGTFSSTHFTTAGGALAINGGAVGTAELTRNSIDVGGNGLKPIRLRIFDALGTQICWIGDDTANSGFTGGWFKILRVGGTTPANSPLVTDSSGNLTITGADFTLKSANAFKILASDGFTTIALLTNAGDGGTIALSKYGSGAFVQLKATTTQGQIDLQDSAGGHMILQAMAVNIAGNQVLGARKTGPGIPSFGSFADVQTWCGAVNNALNATSGHGMWS